MLVPLNETMKGFNYLYCLDGLIQDALEGQVTDQSVWTMNKMSLFLLDRQVALVAPVPWPVTVNDWG